MCVSSWKQFIIIFFFFNSCELFLCIRTTALCDLHHHHSQLSDVMPRLYSPLVYSISLFFIILSLHSSYYTTLLYTLHHHFPDFFCCMCKKRTLSASLHSSDSTQAPLHIQTNFLTPSFISFNRCERNWFDCWSGDRCAICTYPLRWPMLRLLRELLSCGHKGCARTCQGGRRGRRLHEQQ